RALKRLLENESERSAIAVGQRLLDLDPLSEDVHRALMRRYAQAGEIGAALKQYERCRDILHRELAAKPSPETEALQRMIRDHPGTLGSPKPDQPSTTRRQETGLEEGRSSSKPSIAILPF